MINWEEIWKIHAPNFKKGLAFIPLEEGKTCRLRPGPGFGDLSHPTTSLILEMLKPLAQGTVVVDIGCGSGILSIAAALLGAKAVYAFEIDPDAIAHAQENFSLNKVSIHLNTPPPEPFTLACINMISSEQAAALAQYPFMYDHPHTLLSSGILEKERDRYMSSLAPRWTPLEEKASSGWLSIKLATS